MLRHAILAILAVLAPAAVHAAEFHGVRYAAPPGFVETDSWSHECPGDCIYIEGPEDDEWPVLILHAPVTMDAAAAERAFAEGLRQRFGMTVDAKGSRRASLGDYAMTLGLYEYREEYDDPGEGDFGNVAFLEKDGVTVAVEMRAFYFGDLDERSGAYSAFLGSVSFDAVALAAQAKAAAENAERLSASIRAGYARGETARMFLNIDAGVRLELALYGGTNLMAYRTENRLVFLPGGVLIDDSEGEGSGELDYRSPDIAWLTEEGRIGAWVRAGEGYEVTRVDGTKLTYRPGERDGAQTSLSDGETLFWEIPNLAPGRLAGSYHTRSGFSSGGDGSTMARVDTTSESRLTLGADGRFEMSRDGFVGAFGSSFVLSNQSKGGISGRYDYDPASFMLTLTADDGPVLRGPMYPGPGGFETHAATREGDWTVLGDEMWWKD